MCTLVLIDSTNEFQGSKSINNLHKVKNLDLNVRKNYDNNKLKDRNMPYAPLGETIK